MITVDCEQYSEEWWAARVGIPTASCFDQIITPTGKPSTQAKKYLHQLAGERIAGCKTETYQSAAMQRGLEVEEEAWNFFNFVQNETAWQVGLCYPDDKKQYSCSPDGLTETAGLEIKCPLIHTHVEYLLSGTVPTKYIPQIQGSMLVTGFPAWYFLSYYPGLPPLIIKVERDTEYLAKLKVGLEMFIEELEVTTERLRAMQ